MTIDQLQSFMKIINFRIRDRFDMLGHENDENSILSDTVKINEEVGELCNEVLKIQGKQRVEKSMIDGNLAEEAVDVILATLKLTADLGIDIEPALKKKMAKIEQRFPGDAN